MSQKSTKYNHYDLFISYHPEDEFLVEPVCQLFKNYNLRIWYDKDFMEDKLNRFDESLHAIRKSILFICFPTKRYFRNIQCKTEFLTADEAGMNMINLKLENFDFQLTTDLNVSKKVNLKFIWKHYVSK